MVPLVAACGFGWMATDEEILGRSTGRSFTRDAGGHVDAPDVLYKPYLIGAAGESQVSCLFRDHALSDLIGFQYAAWAADAAADDFVRRLLEAGRRYTARTGSEATIAVILDGENAWEHYAGQGRPFLRALYARLTSHPDLRTVTMSEACGGASDRLPSIFPGSWINSDFYIWIGHSDDRRAWGQLAEARRAIDEAAGRLPAAAIARALEEIFIAEGSDWFWWYGDDHSSSHDLEFDDLFRRHVRNVYRALERPIPEELFVTNITTEVPRAEVSRPSGFIQPVIDGEVTSYFEWVGSGCVESDQSAGAMHQVAGPDAALTIVEFGFDLDSLYVRLEGARPLDRVLADGLEVSLNFLTPAGVRVSVEAGPGQAWSPRIVRREVSGARTSTTDEGLRVAIGRIAELQVPFAVLGVDRGSTVAFIVALNRGGAEVEHHPQHRPIEFEVPFPEFRALNWTA
jgi:hypothetical protein